MANSTYVTGATLGLETKIGRDTVAVEERLSKMAIDVASLCLGSKITNVESGFESKHLTQQCLNDKIGTVTHPYVPVKGLYMSDYLTLHRERREGIVSRLKATEAALSDRGVPSWVYATPVRSSDAFDRVDRAFFDWIADAEEAIVEASIVVRQSDRRRQFLEDVEKRIVKRCVKEHPLLNVETPVLPSFPV